MKGLKIKEVDILPPLLSVTLTFALVYTFPRRVKYVVSVTNHLHL